MKPNIEQRIKAAKLAVKQRASASGQDLEGDLKLPEESLDELLSKITDDNKHPEVDWGKPGGKEHL